MPIRAKEVILKHFKKHLVQSAIAAFDIVTPVVFLYQAAASAQSLIRGDASTAQALFTAVIGVIAVARGIYMVRNGYGAELKS